MAVVEGTVDVGDAQPVLPRGERPQLPVREMAGKDDHAAAGGEGAVEMLEADRLDRPARGEHVDAAQMRVFGGDPAEIVPHAADDALDLAGRQGGEGQGEVAPRPPRDAEPRADRPPERAAERRGEAERQQAEGGEEGGRAPGLDAV